jgi:putative ABC transport system substrate-binding protein
MRRRDFITLLGGAAAAWPFAARAQQVPRPPLVAVLSPLSSDAAAGNIKALRVGLRDHGYTEGRNLALELRYGNGVPALTAEKAAELVSLKPAVIVAGSDVSVLAAHNATSTIPIIMSGFFGDPVALGLVTSIPRPGGNVTGTWMFPDDELVGKQLGFLHDVVPGVTRIGVMLNPSDPIDDIVSKLLPSAAQRLRLSFRLIGVQAPDDIETAFVAATRDGAQALFVSSSPFFNTYRAKIAAAAIRERLPAVYGLRQFVDDGGLMSYGFNLPDVYRRSAALVDRILKGTSPADLPIEVPTRFELVINLKTAKALGLDVSQDMLSIADEVIE